MTNVAPAVAPPVPITGPAPRPVTQEDRLLAAAAHLSVFTGFWLVGPLAIYAIKRKESPFAAFHGLQAAIAHVLFGVLTTAGFFAFLVVSAIVGIAAASRHELGALLGLIPLFGLGGSLSGLLLVHLYAAYAAWRGESWSIPLAGRIARAIQSSDEGAAKV
jgi:uncharacterized Tic20 family protein